MPRGPYSLRLSARHAADATRSFVDGVYTATIAVEEKLERVSAWQLPDGSIRVRAASDAGVDHVRFAFGLDDDHSEFLRRCASDPLLGSAIPGLRGLRPLRTATVAHALLRVGMRRGDALVRLCRSLDLEGLKGLPTAAVAQRLERERGLGPWSTGVVCLEGLGRFERGLARDLGLVRLASALWGRRVEAEETDALLAPYEEWAGLASVYLLAGYHAGTVRLGNENRDSGRRPDRRIADRRAA